MQGFNPTQIFLKALVHYWWLFLLFIVLVFIVEYLKSAKFKGKLGEAAASAFMKLKLDPRKYKVFNNIIVNDKKGQTQIDHVVVSKYGIFVIEVKNYNGWIFGNENDEYWTQAIYNKKYKFQNPLRQNYRHIMALSEYLDLDKDYFQSVVFFTGEAEFKTEMPSNVINHSLADYIERFNQEILYDFQLQKIIPKLEAEKA